MTKVTVAKKAGFCFGVKRAVSKCYFLIDEEKKSSGRQIFTLGPIVHNEYVIKNLEELGVRILKEEDIESLNRDSIVIIRAHGVGEEEIKKLKSTGCEIVDETCPFVEKIQKLCGEFSKEKRVFILGDPDHPEIKGIMGHKRGEVTAVRDEFDAMSLPEGNGESVVLLSQTTFRKEKFQLIVEILQNKGYYVNAYNTICNATSERQQEALELSRKSDVMVVIGGSSSSNTKKLYEICSSECPHTQLVQTVKDLDLKMIHDEAVQNVGITAGASTPKEIIEEVLSYVRDEFRADA